MVKEGILNEIKLDFVKIFERRKILGMLLFGSNLNDNQTNRSDIDLCVVSPEEDSHQLFSDICSKINVVGKKYDIKFFTELPLYIQIQVIENGIVVYSPDELDLYEYFYPFRKIWEDQKHRQELSLEELLSLLD